MGQDASQTVLIEISKSELYEVTVAMVNRAETLVNMRAPKIIVDQTIKRAEKFNWFLKQAECDYYPKEKFVDLKERANYESIQ